MNKSKFIDLDTWDRREQFQFFRNYDNPFFGLTANIDLTRLLKYTREHQYSAFAAYLFASQQQVNSIPEFRYRILGDKVVEYETVSAGSTVLKENNVFTFCYFDHHPHFRDFLPHVMERVNACRQQHTPLLDHAENHAQIHYSVIPWVHFSSVAHPRKHGTDDSIPKIIFGKFEEKQGHMLMPISVEVHHGLLDGFHVGLYFEGLQNSINDPETLLEG
ncbi:hypothetical protein HQ531_04045 [bacterium]|nr:hypothetical protein [bacterium]